MKKNFLIGACVALSAFMIMGCSKKPDGIYLEEGKNVVYINGYPLPGAEAEKFGDSLFVYTGQIVSQNLAVEYKNPVKSDSLGIWELYDENGLFGWADLNGAIIVEPKFENQNIIRYPRVFVVLEDGKSSLISPTTGKEITPAKYVSCGYIGNGLFLVRETPPTKKDNAFQAVDMGGNVYSGKYLKAALVDGNVIATSANGKQVQLLNGKELPYTAPKKGKK